MGKQINAQRHPGGISRPGEAAGGFSHCSAAILVVLEPFLAAGPAASHGLHSEHAGTPDHESNFRGSW